MIGDQLLLPIDVDAGYVDDECTTRECTEEKRHYAHDGMPVTVTTPTHAVLPCRGKVRVLSYDGNGMFTVLTTRDVRVSVHRSRLTFTKK